LDPDRLTALEATPPRVRPALSALWNLDLAFADIVATTSQPALGAIRMAWWRERLEELDAGQPRAEPRLLAVAAELLPLGISGSVLSKLEDGWLPLLEPFPWGEAQADGLRERGRTIFAVGAQILGGNPSDAEPAGALWSLVDGATHCSDPDSRSFLCSEARVAAADMPDKVPANVRPLTVLGALAAYDLRPGGRLGRVGVALAHRLKGTIPHG
jgi:15-cis-phytoene synthase